MTDERELEAVAGELSRLDRIAIDSSSIIYLQKAKVLSDLAHAVELVTVPQVVSEVGDEDLPVRVVFFGSGTADERILDCASQLHLPLVSEDRKLLLQAERIGVRYYNALIMLALLIDRDRLGRELYGKTRELLIENARYSKRVMNYGDDLARFVFMRR